MKKGGADLLVELVLSSIIFFVLVFFLFGVEIPKQQVQACAKVVSADAALTCEVSLNNLLRSVSLEGIKYSDSLVNNWINLQKNPRALDAWKGNVTKLFNGAFGADEWQLDILVANGSSIATLGRISTNQQGCFYTVPFPPSLLEKTCGYKETKQLPATSAVIAARQGAAMGANNIMFSTIDGEVSCEVIDSNEFLGVRSCSGGIIKEKSIFEEPQPTTVQNDPEVADSITLPLEISGLQYELTVAEQKDRAGNALLGFSVNVELAKKESLQNCGLTVRLKTIIIHDETQTCRGHEITGD